MVFSTNAAAPSAPSSHFRWLQLAMGIVCMAMIANLQYGWTLFVDPIDAKYHWGRPEDHYMRGPGPEVAREAV